MGSLSFPLSQPLWADHAGARAAAGYRSIGDGRVIEPVQVPEPASVWPVHLYSEPPLSPEEEEALAASAAPRVVQGALF